MSTDCEATHESPVSGAEKPWFIGVTGKGCRESPARFQMEGGLNRPLRRTPLYEIHKALGAKMVPFAGWEMPVWYSSVVEEHLATRQAAGLFDVSHMGVYQIEGADAASFLDSVCCQFGRCAAAGRVALHALPRPGCQCHRRYAGLPAHRRQVPDGGQRLQRRQGPRLAGSRPGRQSQDRQRSAPGRARFGYEAVIRNLRDPQAGADMRVDIALQGPKSQEILLAMGVSAETRKRLLALQRTELCDAKVGGFDLIVSRTGYTGEKMAFELFVHPDRAADFWNAVLKAGEKFGLKPVGLGARDSLRTEAGLPLYGHEMGLGSGKAGEHDLGVGEAGFGGYVKLSKPWFIGREAFMAREQTRKGVVCRFQFPEKGVRMAHNGDPVLDKRGRVIGWVTSCAADMDGTLTGQAYVELKYALEGTHIFVYQSAPQEAGPAPAEMKLGDKGLLPTEALVLSRFPKL